MAERLLRILTSILDIIIVSGFCIVSTCKFLLFFFLYIRNFGTVPRIILIIYTTDFLILHYISSPQAGSLHFLFLISRSLRFTVVCRSEVIQLYTYLLFFDGNDTWCVCLHPKRRFIIRINHFDIIIIIIIPNKFHTAGLVVGWVAQCMNIIIKRIIAFIVFISIFYFYLFENNLYHFQLLSSFQAQLSLLWLNYFNYVNKIFFIS